MDNDKQLTPQKGEMVKWQEAYIEEFDSPRTILVKEDEWNKVHEEVRRLEKELAETQKTFEDEKNKYAKQLKQAVRKLEKAEAPTHRIRIEVRYDRGPYIKLEEYQFVDSDFELSPNVLKEIKKYIAIVGIGIHGRLVEMRDEIAYDLVKEITKRCEDYLSTHVSYTTAGTWPFKETFEDTRLADKVSEALHFAINLNALEINPNPDYKWSGRNWYGGRERHENLTPNAWGFESHRYLNWKSVEREIDDLNRKYGDSPQ